VTQTKLYTAAMIEWLAAYDAASGRCYYIPAELLGSGRTLISLRLTPARNNQRLGTRDAADFLEL
jgi:hypothetical protein